MVNALNIYPVPSISKAKRNALAIRGGELKNRLAEKQLGDYDQDREYLERKRKIERTMKALTAAGMFPGDPEKQAQIISSLGGDPKLFPTIVNKKETKNPTYKIPVQDGSGKVIELSGDQSDLLNFSAAHAMDASALADPDKLPETLRQMQKHGISFSITGGKEPKAPTTRTFQEGRQKVEKQWNPETRRWEEISRGSMDAPDTTGMTRDQARKEYVKTTGAIDRLKATGGLSVEVMGSLSPELQGLLKKADRSKQIQILQSYADTIKREHNLTFDEDVPNNQGSEVTHIFVPGKGLVPK